MAKHHMYDESPAIKHDMEGHTKVEKTPKKEQGDGPEDKGVEGEGFPIHAKHAHERHLMHSRHEHEHALHEHHKMGDKHEMHARHEKEHHEMHTRHEKEMGATGGSPDHGEPIAKIEKETKHG